MLLVVCGSRHVDSAELVAAAIEGLPWQRPVELWHGDARGADRLAGDWAAAQGLPVRAWPADWSRLGKRAGPLRNLEMARAAASDPRLAVLLAIWDGYSRGTAHMISTCTRLCIPTIIHPCHPPSRQPPGQGQLPSPRSRLS